MTAPAEITRSLSGYTLDGDKIVRMAYLDESGIGNIDQEPIAVVAGVIVHADRQWLALDSHLHGMAERCGLVTGSVVHPFHATELFSGGKAFTREKWPKERRWEILDELASIPAKFDLPVVCGCVPRRWCQDTDDHGVRLTARMHALANAFTACSVAIERWMKERAEPDEVALLVMENNDEVKRYLRAGQHVMRNTKAFGLAPEMQEALTLKRIVDTVHFAEKNLSGPLQIADTCAFVIRRYLTNGRDNDRFFEPLKNQLVNLPRRPTESELLGYR